MRNLLLGIGKKYGIKKWVFFASHGCDSVLTQKEACHLLNHRNHFLSLFGLFWGHQAKSCPALTLTALHSQGAHSLGWFGLSSLRTVHIKLQGFHVLARRL